MKITNSGSSSCSFLQPPVISSLLDTNILLITVLANTSNLCFPLVQETNFQTHAVQQAELQFYVF